jgi:hypothetical protein
VATSPPTPLQLLILHSSGCYSLTTLRTSQLAKGYSRSPNIEVTKTSIEQNEKPQSTPTVASAIAENDNTGRFADRFEAEDGEWKRQFERKTLRKVDLRMLPALVIMYLLNFLDRSNLAQARQGTLEADLGMTGTDFNLATSIFFVRYLLMQLPSKLLLTRVKPSLFLSATCCL